MQGKNRRHVSSRKGEKGGRWLPIWRADTLPVQRKGTKALPNRARHFDTSRRERHPKSGDQASRLGDGFGIECIYRREGLGSLLKSKERTKEPSRPQPKILEPGGKEKKRGGLSAVEVSFVRYFWRGIQERRSNITMVCWGKGRLQAGSEKKKSVCRGNR